MDGGSAGNKRQGRGLVNPIVAEKGSAHFTLQHQGENDEG